MFDRPNDFVLEKFPTSKYQGKNLVKNQMRHFAFIVDKYLASVLNGRIDWFNHLKQEDEYERKLVKIFLSAELENEHPISLKFFKGDESRKEDIEEFIIENKIKIQ